MSYYGRFHSAVVTKVSPRTASEEPVLLGM